MKTLATTLCLVALTLPTNADASPQTKDSALVLEAQTYSFDVRDKEVRKDVTVKATAKLPKGWTAELTAADHRVRLEGPVPAGGSKWSAPYIVVSLACNGVCAGSMMIEQMKKAAKKNVDFARKSDRKILKDEEIRPGVIGYVYRFPKGGVKYTVMAYQAGWPRAIQCEGKVSHGLESGWERLYKACADLTAEIVER